MHTEKTVAQQESRSLWELRPLPLTFQIKTLRPHFIFFFIFREGILWRILNLTINKLGKILM